MTVIHLTDEDMRIVEKGDKNAIKRHVNALRGKMAEHRQIYELFMTDPETGESLVPVSSVNAKGDGGFSFETYNPNTGIRWEVEAKISEIS